MSEHDFGIMAQYDDFKLTVVHSDLYSWSSDFSYILKTT